MTSGVTLSKIEKRAAVEVGGMGALPGVGSGGGLLLTLLLLRL